VKVAVVASHPIQYQAPWFAALARAVDLEVLFCHRQDAAGQAAADSRGTALQRVQVIKGYLEGGEHRERIFDVACSDGLTPDPADGRCPDNGARVDLSDCSITAGVGAAELKSLWRDPDFDPGQEAFYYVRVLENPSCRWSTWDAIRAGVKPRGDLPATLQERAWSSPIWYRPAVAAARGDIEQTPAVDAGE
jgi:hypothetical protein